MATIDTSTFFENKKVPLGFDDVSKRDFTVRKRFKIADLTPNQKHVEDWLIEIKRRGNRLTTPYVLNYKGTLLLMDGHHTTIAKKLNGQKFIIALTMTIN
jgi:hypothetical protein